jgi:Fe-S-cluster-containing dehydrogenase component
MEADRRTFLKIAGLAAVGLGVKPTFDMAAALNPAAIQQSPAKAGESKVAAATTRWAMIIDLSKCSEGCEDCAVACHKAHNVPDIGNAKEEVKWLWKEPYENTFPGQGHDFISDKIKEKQTLVLCNHCDNPPCVRVCPTQATWKREDGIVMMDMHRCIGCRFCMAGCPYGSRSFNWRDPRPYIEDIDPSYPTRTRGVVEKCNFCAERIDKGLQPACVEACKNKALIFGNILDPESEVRKALESHYSIVRKGNLGTNPQDYYIIG